MYMEMAAPPDNTPPAAIGHNSRQHEIRKAAEEIRAAYLRNNLRENTSPKWRILHVANVSEMSDAAFRQLFTYIAFGNQNCDNITVSNHSVAVLLQKGERAVQRANKELEKGGWLTDAKHHGPKEPKRVASIPKDAISAIVFEVLGASNVTGVADRKIEVPNLTPLSRMTGVEADYPRQTGRVTPVKDDDITYIDNLDCCSTVIAPSANAPDSENLVSADLVNFQNLLNSWGAKPGDQGLRPKWQRTTTDPTLISAVNAEFANHPRKTVILAARTTILSMQSRATFGDESAHGLRGFGMYFCKVLHGTVLDLIRREAEQKAPAQTARGSPPRPKHWREEKREDAQDTSDVIRKLAQQVRGQQS